MNFKHTLMDSQEAQRTANSEPTDFHQRVLIMNAINTATDANLLTATVVVSTVTEEIRLKLLDELIQLGYAVNGTTTPGSWIISWA